MAKRFGGKFSPGGANGQQPGKAPTPKPGAQRARAGARVNLLFLAPLPLAVTAFFQEPLGLLIHLSALGLLLLAAWLTREGLRAEEAYHARKVARRPAFPRKSAGSVLTGVGLLLAGAGPDGAVFSGMIFGVLGLVLHAFAFGLDPMRDKGIEGVDGLQTDRVVRAVENAEGLLVDLQDALKRTGDRDVLGAADRFMATARAMFRTVEDDPRDLTAARKYLSVYLTGARDASVKFADLYARRPEAEVKSDFLSFLDDLEQNFSARTERLLTDDRTGLDIEIEVLRERLAREGLVADRQTELARDTKQTNDTETV
ncbi:MAG: 5-bromo-4-chloroindolyl phosphate hydrolysis family protein [Pseudomonadota bacterium]